MLLFKNLPPLEEPPTLFGYGGRPSSVSNEVQDYLDALEPTTPRDYYQVDIPEVLQLAKDMSIVDNMYRQYEHTYQLHISDTIPTLKTFLQARGIEQPENILSMLAEEYTIQASLAPYIHLLRQHILSEGYDANLLWMDCAYRLPTFINLLDSSLRNADHLVTGNPPQANNPEYLRTYNFLISRQSRTMEILLSNPSLISEGLKTGMLPNIISTIYFKYSLNYDEHHTKDYLLGLMNTGASLVKDSAINAYIQTTGDSMISDCLHPVSDSFTSLTPSRVLENMYKELKQVWWRTTPPIALASFAEAVKRHSRASINHAGGEERRLQEHSFRKVFNTKGRYEQYFMPYGSDSTHRLKSQTTHPELPEVALVLTVRDSRTVEIPIFIGTSELMDLVLLTPSTTKVMDYIRKVYGIPKPDPFMSYGMKTKFLTAPENAGFISTMIQNSGWKFRKPPYNAHTVDIRTYFDKTQTYDDSPSVYNSWHCVPLKAYDTMGNKQVMEIISL